MTTYQKKHAVDDDDDDSTVVTALTTGTSSPVQRRRKLRFSLEYNQSFPITHVNDIDDAEFFAIWYGPRDYQTIKKNIFLMLRKMKKGEKIEENDEQTVRGIERRTAQGVNLRQKNKLKAMTALLDEQDRQFENGEQNDELLAEAYSNATYHSQEEAYALGLKDQAELQEELDSFRKEQTRMVAPSRHALPAVAHRVSGTAA
jgi:hypothetical protein